MPKYFNTEGPCYPDEHYMVNLDTRIQKIKALVDSKKYFSINRARQYGKTTTLNLLSDELRKDYCVFHISFEGLAAESYQAEDIFCRTFMRLLYDTIIYGEVDGIDKNTVDILEHASFPEKNSDKKTMDFPTLSNIISTLCGAASKPVVLIIDEADQAGNHEIFLSFLGMLRSKYLKRRQRPAFQSVILAGVYDIQNLRVKVRPDKEHQKNSPWNIAADFDIPMSFRLTEIKEMLSEYEHCHHTGMDINEVSQLLYSYTSGYPYLVSRICKLMDEKISGTPDFPDKSNVWTKSGFLEAIRMLSFTKNPLFESMINKLEDYPKLREMIWSILFKGERISYNPENSVIDIASMFGFVKNDHGTMVIANRIFETCFYNYFLSEKEVDNQLFTTGNYYIESRTRDHRRTDIIVDYLGRQYIIEVKIWRGNEYNKRGEAQLADYLDAYRAAKGYLLSFNFNKNKVTGAREIVCGDKVILEVVV